MTKIDVISGFLGAGKTTFIKKLLEEAISGEKVVLIENEFGQIGIDGGFLKDSGIEIREMNSGCICCSLVGDFGKSLEEVLTKYSPDRVLIEPSGVGKLSDVTKAVMDVATRLDVTLNMAVTVVDAMKCKMYMKNFGEFFNNQIEHAGTIVLSRTDVVGVDKAQAAVELLRTLNENATIITTPVSQLDGAQMLEIIEKPVDMEAELMKEVMEKHEHHHEHGEHCGCGCEGHEHEHGEGECHGHHDHGHGEGECHGHGHHDHEHGEGECCGHGHHDHEHGEGECCGHGHHDNEHEEGECCGHGHHDHDHEDGECCGHGHHDHHEHCGCGCEDHDHDHHAEEVFTSFGLEHVVPMDRGALEAVLDELAFGDEYGEVLRAKGMIPSKIQGEWLYFDLVPEEVEVRIGKPDYTGKVCVIGAKLQDERLKKAFGRI